MQNFKDNLETIELVRTNAEIIFLVIINTRIFSLEKSVPKQVILQLHFG